MDSFSKFLIESEKFKKTDKYKEMPDELRDFFNEEIGRFKLAAEIEEMQKREIEKENTGISYEEFIKEWDELKHHYKSWFY